MSADEYQISMAGGDGDPLDAIEARAKAYKDHGTPGLAAPADRAYLLALVRTQAATLTAVRDLANAHGRQGFLVTPSDIRAALDATP